MYLLNDKYDFFSFLAIIQSIYHPRQRDDYKKIKHTRTGIPACLTDRKSYSIHDSQRAIHGGSFIDNNKNVFTRLCDSRTKNLPNSWRRMDTSK